MTLLTILTTVFGIGMALANFPQAYNIFTKKSAGNISFLTYWMLTLGSMIWLIYGVTLSNFPIIMTYGLGTFGCLSVMFGLYFYKN